jgi:hypothetical protein
MLGVLGNILARAGRVEPARALLAELRQRLADGLATSADPAYVLAASEEACDKPAGLAVYFKVESLLDPVRSHRRFSAMLRRLRLE